MREVLTIDSQIWIYYLDSNAKEHQNVFNWLNGKKKDGVLFTEKVVISLIVLLEVAHNFFKMTVTNKELDKDQVEEMILTLMSLDNCQLIEIDQLLVLDVIKNLKRYISRGIGARDTVILITMERLQVQTIATHDKNILGLKSLRRIDPVFDPPLILEIGEEFDHKNFEQRITELK